MSRCPEHSLTLLEYCTGISCQSQLNTGTRGCIAEGMLRMHRELQDLLEEFCLPLCCRLLRWGVEMSLSTAAWNSIGSGEGVLSSSLLPTAETRWGWRWGECYSCRRGARAWRATFSMWPLCLTYVVYTIPRNGQGNCSPLSQFTPTCSTSVHFEKRQAEFYCIAVQ